VGVASDGEFWVAKVLTTVEELERDTKHVTPLSRTGDEGDEDDEEDEEEQAVRQKAHEIIERLRKVRESLRFIGHAHGRLTL
jgi:DNA polymerase phi